MTDRPTQPELLREASAIDKSGPVTCLGMTFTNEEERRAYFTARLREYLQDPAFRAIEGFPIGADEDILALSDPPYYTACPNPFLPQIMAEWQSERAALHANLGVNDETYHREPFAADVSEGKNDPIYNAHSYHTKVPHKAIMRYILHYTEPGDIIFDGFCGTGMTGVAAQLCGDRKTVESLGYQVAADGTISDNGKAIARLGTRKAVLNDLSPAATFITDNYNMLVDMAAFEREAKHILQQVEDECGWMYETWHPHCDNPHRRIGKILYTIWSEVFICSNCNNEIVFWDAAIDHAQGKLADTFICSHCGIASSKRSMERAVEIRYDHLLKQPTQRTKYVPVIIRYSLDSEVYEKKPDKCDLDIVNTIEQCDINYSCPMYRLPEGEKTSPLQSLHVNWAHQLYTKRNLLALTSLWAKIGESGNRLLKFCFTGSLRASTLLASIKFNYYFNGGGGPITPGMKGTYYITSAIPEVPVTKSFNSRIPAIIRSREPLDSDKRASIVTTQSSSRFYNKLLENSIDSRFV